tara:strand:+ start:453 stop:806 length:354 start_codon:yes stop_codon:yes gene_type:complete
MFKHWISYLLIALIACQSVLAVADNHETQATFSTINFNQADLVQSKPIVNDINEQDTLELMSVNTTSCDHCGFCHHGQPVPSHLTFSTSLNSSLLKVQYNDAAPCSPLFSFYRPPKV